MAVYKRDMVDINLETGNIHRSFLKHSIGFKDAAADHFGIRAFRNGEPVNLTGVSIQGIFMPPQGSPIAITSGNIVNYNEAEVVLPQACYNYDGQFTLAIKLVDPSNAVTGTMRIVDGMVDNTHASGTVAPVAAIPSYQEVLSTYEQAIAAINKTVRFDAVQSLTDTQKQTARNNISAASVAELQAEATARANADTALGGRIDDEAAAREAADTAVNNKIGTVPSGKTVQGQIDTLESGKVPKTTTVNGHALSANVTVTKADVGLGNVDNTSDANKPISTAQAAVNTQVSNIIGNTSLPTTAQTLTGAIAEHEGDLTNQQGQITDLKSALMSYMESTDVSYLADDVGRYIKANGQYANSGAYRTTDYIEVPEYAIKVRAGNSFSLGGSNYHLNCQCVFFNEEKTKIGYSDNSTDDIVTVDIPEGTKYVKFNQVNQNNASVTAYVNGFWFIYDFTPMVIESWKCLTVAENPDLNSNSADFHALNPNKIYYRNSTTNSPANAPYNVFRGVVVTLKGVSANTAEFVFAVSSIGEIFFCRSWGSEPGTYSEWYEVTTNLNIRKQLGKVGSATVTFTTTQEIKQTDIILSANTKYLVRVKSYREGRIRMFPHTDSSEYAQLQPWMDSIIVFNNVNNANYLALYNVDATADEVKLEVYEIGSEEAKKDEIPVKYVVSKNEHEGDYTSVTECFLDLKGDTSPKIIEIWEGDYDIFAEYKALQTSGKIDAVPSSGSYNPSTGYAPYNVFIPDNTHVIGKGIVRLNYMPDAEDTYENESKTISPINTAGSMILENVEINCKHGRYCIHDDPAQDPAYGGAIKKYINVRSIKHKADSPELGYMHNFGCGVSRSMRYEFDNCYFETKSTNAAARTLYFHNRAVVGGVLLTEAMSSNIVVKNSIMKSASNTETKLAVFLGNIGATGLNIHVDIDSCWIGGSIVSADEGDATTGNNSNTFNIRTLLSKYDSIVIRDSENAYIPQEFNA